VTGAPLVRLERGHATEAELVAVILAVLLNRPAAPGATADPRPPRPVARLSRRVVRPQPERMAA
jgi:hypothetical protein